MTSLSPDESPIALRAKKCVEQFGTLVSLSHQSDAGLSEQDAIDALGRFKIWSGNLGALQQYELKSSLDYRLRNAPKISIQIVDLLEELAESIEDACMILSNDRANRKGLTSPNTVKGLDNEDTPPDDTNIQGDDAEELSEIREILDSIVDAISSLFRLSMLIRNNTSRDRYAKAAAAAHASPFDEVFDISHVRHRFPALQSKGKEWLIIRSGKAITQRRQYLRYCREHHDKTSKKPQSMLKVVPEPHNYLAFEAPVRSTADGRTTLTIPTSTLAPTQASTFLLTQEQLPDEDLAEDSQSQTSYATSEAEDSSSDKLHVMQLDDAAKGQHHFECPYCWQIQTTKTHKSWKKHVLSDLKPYLCTFEKCELKLFSDQHTWFSHELKDHRQEWWCYFCTNKQFDSATEYTMHLNHCHSKSFSTEQVPALLEMSQRVVNQISPTDCPFCDDWETRLRKVNTHISLAETISVTPNQYKIHVGSHMEQLALFAVPRGFTEPGEADSDNAVANEEEKAASRILSVIEPSFANELRLCEEMLIKIKEIRDLPSDLADPQSKLSPNLLDISQKLESGAYKEVRDFEIDVLAMCRNFITNDLGDLDGKKLVYQLSDSFEFSWALIYSADYWSQPERWRRWKSKQLPYANPRDGVSIFFDMRNGQNINVVFSRKAYWDDLYAFVDCHENRNGSEARRFDLLPNEPKPEGYVHEYHFELTVYGTTITSRMRPFSEMFGHSGYARIRVLAKHPSAPPTAYDLFQTNPETLLIDDDRKLETSNTKLPPFCNLRVTIVKATRLRMRDVFDSPYPFVILTEQCAPKITTNVCKHTRHPYWNESFDLFVGNSSELDFIIADHTSDKDWEFLGITRVKVGDYIDLASTAEKMEVEVNHSLGDGNSPSFIDGLTTRGEITILFSTILPEPLRRDTTVGPFNTTMEPLQKQLPKNWTINMDNFGRFYYSDHINGTTTWDMPSPDNQPSTVGETGDSDSEDAVSFDFDEEIMLSPVYQATRRKSYTSLVSEDSAQVIASSLLPNVGNFPEATSSRSKAGI